MSFGRGAEIGGNLHERRATTSSSASTSGSTVLVRQASRSESRVRRRELITLQSLDSRSTPSSPITAMLFS